MEMIDLSTGTTTITIEPSTGLDEELEVISVHVAPDPTATDPPKLSDLLDWHKVLPTCVILSKALISRLANGGHLIIHHPVRSLMTLMGFASVLAGIVALAPVTPGQIISEEGLELARWTAWKEFRDDCLETKKEGAVSQDCEEAIRTPLPPPPHVNIHAATVRRALDSHNEVVVLPAYVNVALSIGAILVASVFAVLLCHRIQTDHRMKSLARHHLSSIEEVMGSDGQVYNSIAETRTKDEDKEKETKPNNKICKKCENLEDKLAVALKYQEDWEDMQDKLTTALEDLRDCEAERRELLVTPPFPSRSPAPQISPPQQKPRRRRGYEWETGQQYDSQHEVYSQQSSDAYAPVRDQDETTTATGSRHGLSSAPGLDKSASRTRRSLREEEKELRESLRSKRDEAGDEWLRLSGFGRAKIRH